MAQLEEIRDTVGPYWWAGQWQCRPSPPEGAMFKRSLFKYWDWVDADRTILALHDAAGDRLVPYEECEVVAFMDTAATEDEDSDWTVISVWAVTPFKDLVLLDVVREQTQTVHHRALVEGVIRRWRCLVHIERKTFGLSLIQDLAQTGLPIAPVEADANKIARARGLQARYQVSKVYHPAVARWLEDWETELLAFPKGTHDDQVDTGAYAAGFLSLGPPEPRIRSL